MSYPDQPGGSYPPRNMRDPGESQYPPPPEEDDRTRAYHQRGPSTNVTLPSISPCDPQYAALNRYPPDLRAYRPDPYMGGQLGPYGRDDRGGYRVDYGRGPPQHMNFSQSAPRQRTAIACRYCRRRKIRCSGFEQNAQGRCSNCQRFHQDCIFSPVSSQATAFVPAHAACPHMRNMAFGPDMMYLPEGLQLYGAHGQPLGQIPQPPAAGSPYNEYAMPSHTGSYSSYTEDSSETGRKRPQTEPHQSILPPPLPGQPGYARSEGSRRAAAEEEITLRLPPVTPTDVQANSNYSSGSSTSSKFGLRPPQDQGLPSMSRTPPPRTSPGDRADPMSLGNIMQKRPGNNIDKNMLSRLNRKG